MVFSIYFNFLFCVPNIPSFSLSPYPSLLFTLSRFLIAVSVSLKRKTAVSAASLWERAREFTLKVHSDRVNVSPVNTEHLTVS